MMLIALASLALDRQARSRRSHSARRADGAGRVQGIFAESDGIIGFVGRLLLLGILATLSYFLGAGLALFMQASPVSAAILITAVFVSWAAGDAA